MKYKKILKNLILFLFIIIFIFAGVVLIWIVSLKIPPIKSIYDLKTAQSTKIFDRNGVLLFRLFEKEARTVIPITKISQNMINAIISVEDRLFFEHDGLRFQLPSTIVSKYCSEIIWTSNLAASASFEPPSCPANK